jgi:outer membrane protein OmpA-like peptidoglycan-associated protein
MKYLKSFKLYEANESAAVDEASAQFTAAIANWNKTYGQVFKFESDSDTKLAPEYLNKAIEAVKKLGDLMKTQPKIKVEIVAHTDSLRPTEKWGHSNDKLSQARAEFVVRQISRYASVPEGNISAVGKGESELLIKPDDTPEKQAKNRRAEVRVTGSIGTPEPTNEVMTMTKTNFIPDSIVPTTVADAQNLGYKYRVVNKTQAPKVKNGVNKLLYSETVAEVIKKVNNTDISEIKPAADSELIVKLTEIGKFFVSNVLPKNGKLLITGYSVADEKDYAEILSAARATYMKKVLLSLTNSIKPDMILTTGKQVEGGLKEIMAKVDFVDANGKLLDKSK